MNRQNRGKRAGRPAAGGGRDAKTALLEAARALFAQRAFATVTVRELAATAGVNPALVNYHFGGKEGIYEAMVADTVGPVLEQLERAAGGTETLSLDQFFARYQATLASNPWLPNLVVREVLYSEGPFRDTFMQRFAARAGRALAAMVAREQDAGKFRADLNPRLAALSLLSLAVFPFIARPLVERGLGLATDAAFFERLNEHNRRLFRDGARSTRGIDS